MPQRFSDNAPIPLLQLPQRVRSGRTGNLRQRRRAEVPFQVKLRRDNGPASAASEVVWEGVNISSSGMLCVAAEPIWPGNQVTCEVCLTNARQAVVEGFVAELLAWQEGVAMRICFAPRTADDERCLDSWLDEVCGAPNART